MPPKSSTPKFQPKDMVLAKMTGFPAWPSFVMPQDMISDAIMKAKKKTTNTCVIFIPDGDFNWMNEKSLEILTPEKLKAKISKLPKDKLKPKPRKNGTRTNNVADALVAADGLKFQDFMDELAINSDAKESKDEDVQDDEDIEDEMADSIVGLDADDKPSTKRKKRVAAVMSEDEDDDSHLAAVGSETEKTDITGNVNGNGNGNNNPERNKMPPEVKKQKPEPASSNKSVAAQTNEKNKPSKKENGTASPKAMSEKDKQHHFWLCRVKLQRSLIQRNQSATPKDPKLFPPPTVDELLVARLILNRLDLYPVNVDLLRETKIHKVLKCILKDEDLAFPESFRLHEKCEELLMKWKEPMEQLKNEKQAKSETRERTSNGENDPASDNSLSVAASTAPTSADSAASSGPK